MKVPKSQLTALNRFHTTMFVKLSEKQYKGGWEDLSPSELLSMLKVEVKELEEALDKENTNRRDIAREAADVANFAMMIADVCGGLDEL